MHEFQSWGREWGTRPHVEKSGGTSSPPASPPNYTAEQCRLRFVEQQSSAEGTTSARIWICDGETPFELIGVNESDSCVRGRRSRKSLDRSVLFRRCERSLRGSCRVRRCSRPSFRRRPPPPGESSRIGETTRFYRAIYANGGCARTSRFH